MLKKIIDYIFHPTNFIIFFASRNILKVSDKTYLKILYKNRMREKLNLENPQTFNEKLQWLKLHDRNELYTTLVDKYEVKKYVSNIIGEKYIIPTLGIYDKFEEINFDSLPNQFVLKCTHDSGSVVICKNKNFFDKEKARKKIEKSLKKNFYYLSREWPYKNVKPRILVETYMQDEKKEDLLDYKLLSFNGKVKCSFVCSERQSEKGLAVDFYDRNWEHMSFRRHYRNSLKNFLKPKNYELMVQLAEKLAENIPFARIDFYEINNHLYFGEITFYPGGGLEEFIPQKYDKVLGKWLVLNKVKMKESLVIRSNETGVLETLENFIGKNFFYKNFDNYDSLFFRLAKKFNLFYLSFYFGAWFDYLDSCKTFIIFDTAYNKKLISYIKKHSKAKIILYYWNSINQSNQLFLTDSNISEIWTFDKENALEYNLKWNPQFFTNKINLVEKNFKHDVLFLGRDKGRRKVIDDLVKVFEQNHFQIKIFLVNNEKDFIPYNIYLQFLKESKAVLDISSGNQTGLTLRVMEALFLEKKLITNNKDIKNYQFYNSNNIFIIGEDNLDNLKNFIKKDYEPVAKELIEYYDFNNWLKRF